MEILPLELWIPCCGVGGHPSRAGQRPHHTSPTTTTDEHPPDRAKLRERAPASVIPVVLTEGAKP